MRIDGIPEIPVTLQIQPELRTSLERLTQCQCRIGTDLAAAVDDLVEARIGPAKVRGKGFLGHTKRFQKLFQQHLARVCGGAFFRSKIFFTNGTLKHKIKNREFWGFTGCREFKREVAKTYPENWNNYIVVDPRQKLKLAYNKKVGNEIRLKKQEHALKDYNEFDL